MDSHANRIVEEAEQQAETLGDALDHLRKLSLDEFSLFLLSQPNPAYPKLGQLLPAMASEEAQRNWTGNAGLELLKLTLSFVRSLHTRAIELRNNGLTGKRILDFGCGYGRIARPLFYFTDPENYFGVDPWQPSLDECAKARMPGNLALSDYLPETLPVPDGHIDIAFAFSVFTHLSERATRTCLSALRKALRDDGLLVITIRTEDYWRDYPEGSLNGRTREDLLADHIDRYAFVPHGLPPVGGEITYGDAGFTLEWLEREIRDWRVVSYDFNMADWYQLVVFLEKA